MFDNNLTEERRSQLLSSLNHNDINIIDSLNEEELEVIDSHQYDEVADHDVLKKVTGISLPMWAAIW
jgi:hypothetical protein